MQPAIQLVVGLIVLTLASLLTAWMFVSIAIMLREQRIEEKKAQERLVKQIKREKSRARKMWKK